MNHTSLSAPLSPVPTAPDSELASTTLASCIEDALHPPYATCFYTTIHDPTPELWKAWKRLACARGPRDVEVPFTHLPSWEGVRVHKHGLRHVAGV